MPKTIPPATPELNRLRAATGLIPIIESGLADGNLAFERAALMASFCEWACQCSTDDPEQKLMVEIVNDGLRRVRAKMAISSPIAVTVA